MIITQTPLRISFAGGGTDLPDYYQSHEGYVVSSAINKFVFVVLNSRYDDKIYVNYSKKEIVDRVEDLQHELVRETMLLTGVTRGVEVTMLSDIPAEGSGLASSSSFTVGLLNAFHIYRGEQVSALQLAREACEIEIDRCRKPIGKQDQYIAACGGVMAFRFRSDGEVDAERINLAPRDLRRLSAYLCLFYTDQTRSAVTILTDQKQSTAAKLAELHGIKGIAISLRNALMEGNFDQMGKALHTGWALKKELSVRISNSRIDEMYDLALRAGACGGKVCGAGGGGFLLLYCPPSKREQVQHALAAYREMPFDLEPEGSKVIFNYRHSAWQ